MLLNILVAGSAHRKGYSAISLFGTSPGIHPALKREDRLGEEPFAGFGTVVEDITGSGYTKNQPILLGAF